MKNNKKKGFTLVELLVVIAILAILATVATVGYTAFIESATVSNDENAAAQLNQFLAAVKADSNGPFYGKDINEDNIMELTQYILDDSGYGDLIPQAAKYGYHFYFDLDEEKYVLIGDKDERILSMSPLSMLFASAAGESTNGHPESCFTEGRRYFLVETGTELSELVAGFKNITTADGLKEYYAKVSDYKTDAKQSLTGLITLVEKTVFATAEGYLVVEDAGHTVLFVPANLDGVKLSGVKVNVLNNKATTPISSENPLITLGDGYVFNIPKPEMIFGNALWFDGEHYTPDENDEYTTTLKFNLSLEEIKAIVDQNFTNVVFELNDGKQYGYIDGAIVCLTDGTSTEVTSKVGVQSFKIGIEGKTEESAYSVPFDVAKTETYKMYAYGFVSTDSFNPDNVPDETVTWEIVEDQYTPDNADIDENGVITGVSAGIIRVKAISTVTNTATAEFIINIGAIDGILGIAYANGNGSNSGTIEFDANTGEPDEIINHQINNESNNNFTFTVTPNYYIPNITNCDDTFSVVIDGDVQPEFELDQANNTVSVNFTKAGTYTITVAYVAYPEVSRTFTVKVTNVVTSFEVGYMDGEYKVINLIYKDFKEVNGTTFDMDVFVTTSDGSDNMTGHTVTWSCVGPNGDVAIDTDGKFTVTAAGTYTISATVEGTTKEFNLYVDSPLRPEISFNGTKADIDDEKVDNKFAAEMPGDYYYQMGSVAGNKIPFTVAVKYTYGVTFGNITPDITTSDNATYADGYLTITKAGDVVVTISVPGYDELTTVFTVEARNKVTGLDLTVNDTTNSVEKIDDKFYIIPSADNNFTVDASFTFQYEGEKINPDITWSVESGAEYVECTKNGEIIGTFHIKAKPATGTVITIKATDSVNNLEKTVKIVINELTSFDLDCSDIKDGDKVKLHAIGNTIYVAYDLTTGSFTLTPTDFKGVDNAPVPPSSVTWSTSDTAGEYISIDNGTVTIKKALMDDITITATAAGGKTVTMGIKVDKMTSVTLTGLNKNVDKDSTDNVINIKYKAGVPTTYTIGVADYISTQSLSGKLVICDTTVTLTPGTGSVLTVDNVAKTITLNFTDGKVNEGSQTVTINVGGHIEETFTINVVDASNNPFVTNNITSNILIGDTYLYRVGNENSFALSNLFSTVREVGDVTLTIYDVIRIEDGQYYEINNDSDEDNDFDAVYTSNLTSATWTDSTIKFTGTGVALIEIKTTKGGTELTTQLFVEVLDATNITSNNTTFPGGSVVLLSDITVSSSRSITNGTLYGNGYTISAPDYHESGVKTGIVELYDANIDNVRIVGGTYLKVGFTSSPYHSDAVYATGDCSVSNAFISGCRSPIRIAGGNLTLDNVILDGGVYANLNVEKCENLILRDVTTIQTLRVADVIASEDASFESQPNDKKTVMGLGIYVEDLTTNITIEGDLRQHNWLSGGDLNYFNDTIKTVAQTALAQTDYQHSVDGEIYVNTGILFPGNHTGTRVDNRSDDAKTKVEYLYKTISGAAVWSYSKTLQVSNNRDRFNYTGSFVPKQAPTVPIYDIDFDFNCNLFPENTEGNPSCISDATKKTLTIYVKKDVVLDGFEINLVNATKYGQALGVTVTVEKKNTDGTWVVLAGWPTSFSEDSEYRVTYSYIDSMQYDKDGQPKDDTSSVRYEKTIFVVVNILEEEFTGPIFTFPNGTGYQVVVIDGKSYVSAVFNSENASSFDYVTITGTKEGDTESKNHTIYYPIVQGTTGTKNSFVSSGSEFIRYYYTFPGTFAITDGENTYNSSTKTKPANLTLLVTEEKVVGTADSYGYHNGNGKYGDEPIKSVDNKLAACGVWNGEPSSDTVLPASSVLFKYSYVSNGVTYYYYIDYEFAEHTIPKKTCVTSDTLITLADGTQVPVESLTGNEMLLVWDHTTGKLTSAPIAYIVNHDKTVSEHSVLRLTFSNGNTLDMIAEHVFYDKTLNKYVPITPETVNEYIGHTFIVNERNRIEEVTLVSAENILRNTGIYEVVTYKNMVCFTNGILSASAYIDRVLNVFDINADTMTYDVEQMMKDIETYGLYTYEDFAGLVPEEAFEMYNAAYLKIAVGKGYITWDDIIDLIDIYYNNDVTPIQ